MSSASSVHQHPERRGEPQGDSTTRGLLGGSPARGCCCWPPGVCATQAGRKRRKSRAGCIVQVFSVRSCPLGDCLCAGPSHAGRLALEAELEPRSLRPSGVFTDMPSSVLPPGFHQALPSSGNNFLCLPGSLYSWCHFLGEAYREPLDQQRASH